MVRLKEQAIIHKFFNILFQFHYGTIKSRSGWTISRYFENFNSTMVRLKGLGVSASSPTNSKFQFHYGTIKSASEKTLERPEKQISIPLWYD